MLMQTVLCRVSYGTAYPSREPRFTHVLFFFLFLFFLLLNFHFSFFGGVHVAHLFYLYVLYCVFFVFCLFGLFILIFFVFVFCFFCFLFFFLCCLFFFVFVLCLLCLMFPVSLDCPLLIVHSDFSKVYATTLFNSTIKLFQNNLPTVINSNVDLLVPTLFFATTSTSYDVFGCNLVKV